MKESFKTPVIDEPKIKKPIIKDINSPKNSSTKPKKEFSIQISRSNEESELFVDDPRSNVSFDYNIS